MKKKNELFPLLKTLPSPQCLRCKVRSDKHATLPLLWPPLPSLSPYLPLRPPHHFPVCICPVPQVQGQETDPGGVSLAVGSENEAEESAGQT